MTALLESPTNQVQSFLAAGHICAIMEAGPSTSRSPRSTRCRSS
ncbi:MAG: hypothetical protein U0838_14340 [Chloroflexota bacterium]